MFYCKFCGREMNVSFLEYKSNSYCNLCFDERAKSIENPKRNTFEFMGEVISLGCERCGFENSERWFDFYDCCENCGLFIIDKKGC